MAGLSLKSLIWTALVLCTDCALRAGEEGPCLNICNSIKAEISASEACARSRKSLPRPKIGRICQEGFDEAFKLTCGELCSLYGTRRAVPSFVSEACDKRKREVPRPVAHKACMDGFNAGVVETIALINKRIEIMEQDERTTLLESNLSELKELDAERDILDGVVRVREAEEAKKRREGLERAQEAIEERSAEVKREKEALSNKQAIETPQAAEEVERNKRRAKQERQARIRADVTEFKEEARISSIGAVATESIASTGDQQSGRGTDDGAAARPETQNMVMFNDPEKGLRASAPDRAPDTGPESGTTKVQDALRSGEVLIAEQVEGYEALLPRQDGGSLQEMPESTEGAISTPDDPADAGLEDGFAVDLLKDVRHAEFPITVYTEDLDTLLPQEDDARRHETLVDSGGAAEADAPDAGPGNDIVELRDDPWYHDVLKAEHVGGYETLKAQLGSGASQEAADRMGVTTDDESDPKEMLTIELPNDPRFREVLTAEHIKSLSSPLAREGRKFPSEMPGGEGTGAHSSRAAGSEGELRIEPPADGRYREVMAGNHVAGLGAETPLDQEGNLPRGLPVDPSDAGVPGAYEDRLASVGDFQLRQNAPNPQQVVEVSAA